MLFSVEQAFVGRDERRASLKTPACEANLQPVFTLFLTLRGGSRIFFRRGCTRLLLYFNTNKLHSFFFFCRIPVVLENLRSSRGGGGVGCALPAPSSAPDTFDTSIGILKGQIWFGIDTPFTITDTSYLKASGSKMLM